MSKPVKMFEKAAFGYRTEDVDNHIDELNKQISSLEAEKEELVAKMRVLAEKINEYRKEESDLKDALLGAQKMGNTILSEAKTKADMMITDAKSRAERMIYDAQKQAEETVGAIQRQTEKEKMTLAKMQKEVSDFKATLLATYKRHLNVITNLPEMDAETAEFYNEKLGSIKEDTVEEVQQADSAPEVAEEAPAAVKAEESVPLNETVEKTDETVSTMRFDKVQSNSKPAFTPTRKPTFEEKFGELKFGKNNNR